jgi:hypothetical protein
MRDGMPVRVAGLPRGYQLAQAGEARRNTEGKAPLRDYALTLDGTPVAWLHDRLHGEPLDVQAHVAYGGFRYTRRTDWDIRDPAARQAARQALHGPGGLRHWLGGTARQLGRAAREAAEAHQALLLPAELFTRYREARQRHQSWAHDRLLAAAVSRTLMLEAEIEAAPRHPQLMDPAEPEELIAASIWWYPLIFPTRTDVLRHLLLVNGNGYAWDGDGQVRSVFAHIEPDYETLESRYREYQEPGRDGRPDPETAAWEREQLASLLAVRREYRDRARTYGPDGWAGREDRPLSPLEYGYTLLGRAPQAVHPRWQPVLAEASSLFAGLLPTAR